MTDSERQPPTEVTDLNAKHAEHTRTCVYLPVELHDRVRRIASIRKDDRCVKLTSLSSIAVFGIEKALEELEAEYD